MSDAEPGARTEKMPPPGRLEGIVAIPVTPFTERDQLDEDGIVRQLDFALACGATGILAPVIASEAFVLADDERRKVAAICLEHLRAVPVIVGVSASNARSVIEASAWAAEQGAAAVCAMPPSALLGSEASCVGFFERLAGAVEIPIVVQNFPEPIGTPMPIGVVARLAEIDAVRYVKEEVPPQPPRIAALVAATESIGHFAGVFGGGGGVYLIDELARGALGNMAAAHTIDVLVASFEAFRAGDVARAGELHRRLLPLLTFERCYGGIAVYKEVLRRRGVIASARSRLGEDPLDEAAHRELDRLLGDLEDLLITAAPA